jgi:Acetyltransferase (isoleucine patch superfamily)
MAIIAKPLLGRNAYMTIFIFALKQRGGIFTGKPRYIDPDVYIDAEGGLSLGDNFIASTQVIILTHDYSFTTGLEAIGKRPYTDVAIRLPVTIGKNCFIGAGSVVLPGTIIEDNVIIGAGSVWLEGD